MLTQNERSRGQQVSTNSGPMNSTRVTLPQAESEPKGEVFLLEWGGRHTFGRPACSIRLISLQIGLSGEAKYERQPRCLARARFHSGGVQMKPSFQERTSTCPVRQVEHPLRAGLTFGFERSPPKPTISADPPLNPPRESFAAESRVFVWPI